MDREILRDALEHYKADFVGKTWSDERFKWQAVKCFQYNWDIAAEDFAGMLKNALAKTDNLLASQMNFPRGMLEYFADKAADELRQMFVELFDEGHEVVDRILAFKEKSVNLLQKYGDETTPNHFQSEHAITTYLWLRYPDKYYIYKFTVAKNVSQTLRAGYEFKQGLYRQNLENFYAMYNELHSEAIKDESLLALLKSQLTAEEYPDSEYRTLVTDISYYISEQYQPDAAAQVHYWWLNANPRIWSFANIAVGEEQEYTLLTNTGNKRRIYQNFLDAKAGDPVICYESTPNKRIVALGIITLGSNGEAIRFRKTGDLVEPIKYAEVRNCPELAGMEYFSNPNGSLFKLTKDEYSFIMDMVGDVAVDAPPQPPIGIYTKTDFLQDVYMSEDKYHRLKAVLLRKKNIILQGAPGTGKTYAAKRLAYSLMGEANDSCIEMVQFHQNYSYEDFVMGYKPNEEGFELRYGIFYRFCQRASGNPNRNYYFIIDEINRGNLSKIFGELLMLIESDYRGKNVILSGDGSSFAVPGNVYIIGMMNTADRSLAMIDYALRRRFSFIDMEPAFATEGFRDYQGALNSETLDRLVEQVILLNKEIGADASLGKGFCIGHSYFCHLETCSEDELRNIVDFDILPMLEEYWFDDPDKVQRWQNALLGVFHG